MKRLLGGAVLAVAFLVLLSPPAVAAAAAAPDMGAIDAYVRSQMEDAHIPGLAVGIVHGNQVVHTQGFGKADPSGRPVTAQTPFIIGSVSKSVTALAVMQLVEAGKVDLDQPVRGYVPDFRVADATASGQITVRQLLNQTSGIPTSAGIAPLSKPTTTLDAQVRALAGVSLSSPPGRQYQYSNSNYEVLGRLVEVISGQSYEEYVQQHVFAPLDMRHSYADLTAAKADGLSVASTLWFGIPQARPQGAGFRADTVPAGFLMSSAEDMSHYLVALLNGGAYGGSSVLSQGGVATLQRGAAPAGLSAQNGSYAMGWFAGPREKLTDTVWHNGSAAGMHAMVVMQPSEKWGVVLLTNTESLLHEFFGRIDVIADNVLAMLTGRPLAGTLAGLYWAFDGAVILVLATVVRKLIRLVRQGPPRRTGRLARTRTIVFNRAVPIWRELWVPLAIILGVPAVLGAPWLGNLITTDVGQFLLLLAGLLLTTGITRVVVSVRRRSARRPTERLISAA